MAARRVDPPNNPPARLPGPQAAAAVSGARPNVTPPGSAANAVTRPPARKSGSNEGPETRDARRVSGGKRVSREPQPAGAHAAQVLKPAKRDGSEAAETSLRDVLFDFTAPAGGLPSMRSAETVAILRDLLAMLPTLPDDLGALAASALRQEIACQSALLARSHQSVVR